jgi:hypothetical protein
MFVNFSFRDFKVQGYSRIKHGSRIVESAFVNIAYAICSVLLLTLTVGLSKNLGERQLGKISLLPLRALKLHS